MATSKITANSPNTPATVGSATIAWMESLRTVEKLKDRALINYLIRIIKSPMVLGPGKNAGETWLLRVFTCMRTLIDTGTITEGQAHTFALSWEVEMFQIWFRTVKESRERQVILPNPLAIEKKAGIPEVPTQTCNGLPITWAPRRPTRQHSRVGPTNQRSFDMRPVAPTPPVQMHNGLPITWAPLRLPRRVNPVNRPSTARVLGCSPEEGPTPME
jgi:hypothetical protein